MKKYISVFEMLVRSTFYKVLLVIIAMLAAQTYMFWNVVMNGQEGKVEEGLETLVDNSLVIWPLAIGFVLVTVILCLSGCNIGSNQGYTLRRLRIAERTICILQAIYNCICYFLLWASQVALTIGISFMYEKQAALFTNQSIVIAFYRNSFLHSILPMEDGIGWLMLIGIILGCGIAAAEFPYRQRQGKTAIGIILMCGATCAVFPRGLNGSITMLSISIACLVGSAWIYFGSKLMKKVEKEHE